MHGMQPSHEVPSSSQVLCVNPPITRRSSPPSKRRRTTSPTANSNPANPKTVSFPPHLPQSSHPPADHPSTVPSPSPSASADPADPAWPQHSRSLSRSQSNSLSPSASASASRSRSRSRSQIPPQSFSPSQSRSPSPADSRTVSSQLPTPPTAKWFRKPSVVWYRGHDLRVEDHPALLAAAQRGGPVIPFFVWDPSDSFGANLGSIKLWWLRQSLTYLQSDLHRLGVKLYTRAGSSTDELRSFLNDTGADAVFWNRSYEPDLLKRDEELRDELSHDGFTAESFKAELLVEPWELSKSETSPRYDTFQAYMRAWMTVPPPPHPFPSPSRLKSISRPVSSVGIDSLGLDVPPDIERAMRDSWVPGSAQAKIQLDKFLREVFPAFGEGHCRRHFEGTSRLSPHIRFGELSPRRMYHSTRLQVARWDQSSVYLSTPSAAYKTAAGSQPKDFSYMPDRAPSPTEGQLDNPHRDVRFTSIASSIGDLQPQSDENMPLRDDDPNANPVPLNVQDASAELKYQRQTHRKRTFPHISLSARAFLKNLCLRDFAYHVLFHNPTCNTQPLIREFSSFPWAEDDGSFAQWRQGTTGYPIVDAAMRELKQTGWIHNGMRFLLACFLTKNLLLPWSQGLKEFYGLLADGDRSSNALGWQWTAGCNTDAFPCSRLVNPIKIAHHYDPTGNYVRRWIPELAKLPNEFVHEPWKAPETALKMASIEMGMTYPKRIILMQEARSRLYNAVFTMKQIFAGSSVWRSIPGATDSEVKEWPDDHPDELRFDDSSFSGKINLLPSLWNLLERDSSSSYLAGSSSGSDALIAMDTASLVEGALAVPIDEHHESIEHALITAHEQNHFSSIGEEHMSAHSPPLGSTYITDGGDSAVPDLQNMGADMSEGQVPRDGYGKAEVNVDVGPLGDFDRDRRSAGPYGGGSNAVVRKVEDAGYDRVGGLATAVSCSSHLPHLPQGAQATITNAHVSAAMGAQFGIPPMPGFGIGGTHTAALQTANLGHAAAVPPHPIAPITPVATGPSPGVPTPQQTSIVPLPRTSSPPVTAGGHGLVDYRRNSVDGIGGAGPHVLAQGGRGVLPNVEGPLYVGGVGSAANIVSSMGLVAPGGRVVGGAGVGGAATGPVVMSGAGNVASSVAGDMTGGGSAFGADGNGALYAHHLNVGQFYGFPHVMPMLGGHAAGDRGDLMNGGGAPSTKFGPMSGMIPMGYGMYGGGMFDGGLMGGAGFGANGSGYGAHAGAQGVAQGVGAPPSLTGVSPVGVSSSTHQPHHQAVHHMNVAAAPVAAVGYDMSTTHPMYMHGSGVGTGVGGGGGGGDSVMAEVGDSKNNVAVDVAGVGIDATASRMNGAFDSGLGHGRGHIRGHGQVPSQAQGHVHGHGHGNSDTNERGAAAVAVPVPTVERTGNSGSKSVGDGVGGGGHEVGRRRSRVGNGRNNNNNINNHNNNNNNMRSTTTKQGTGLTTTTTTATATATTAKTKKKKKKKVLTETTATKGDGDVKGEERKNDDDEGGDGDAGNVGNTGNNGDQESRKRSLKAREEVLSSILDKTDEFNGFAKFLNEYYELTANTNRQTSKDYVRLCNLKDDYHKQCNTEKEKEKFKIYRMKSFFSKILKLEVTGEWDRHNHGGVRGPYVYGIRLRKEPQQSSLQQHQHPSSSSNT